MKTLKRGINTYCLIYRNDRYITNFSILETTVLEYKYDSNTSIICNR